MNILEQFTKPTVEGWKKKRTLKKELKEFISNGSYSTLSFDLSNDLPIYEDVNQVKDILNDIDDLDVRLYRVWNEPFEMTMSYPELKDSEGIPFGAQVSVIAKFLDSRDTLTQLKDKLAVVGEVSDDKVSSMLVSQVELSVKEGAKAYRHVEQRKMDAIWWKNLIASNNPFTFIHIVSVEGIQFNNERMEAIEKLQREKRLLAEEEAAERIQKEAELRHKKIHQEYEERIAEMEHRDKQRVKDMEHYDKVREMERNAEIQKMMKAQEIDRINREKEVEERKIQMTKFQQETKMKDAEIAKNYDEMAKLRQEKEESIKASEAMIAKYSQSVKELEDSIGTIQSIVEQGFDPKSLSERIAELNDFSFDSLLFTKASKDRQLSSILKKICKQTKGHLSISGLNTMTRDIGLGSKNKKKKYQTIRIGEDLSFKMTSDADGYLTLLNIGTSGKVSILAPNFHIPPYVCKVVKDETYLVPGDSFLPEEIPFEEMGPVGRKEEIFSIVTKQPLFTDSDLADCHEGPSLLELDEDDVEAFVEKINVEGKQVIAGIMSLYVEE